MLSELPVVTLTEVGGAAVQCDPVDTTAAESRDVVGTACGDTVTEVGSAAVQCDPVETAAAEFRDVVGTACGDTLAEVGGASLSYTMFTSDDNEPPSILYSLATWDHDQTSPMQNSGRFMENSVVGIAVTDSPTDVCGAADQRDSVYATAAESCDVVGTACGDTVTEVGGAAVQCDPVETAAAESRDVVETACGDTVAEVQSAVVAGDPCYPSHPVDTMVALSEGLSASHTLLIEKPVDSHTQSTADGAIASHARSKPVRRRVAEPLLWKKNAA